MGPWSILARRWLPLPAVYGHKGHSLVFKTGETIPAEALFLEYQEASGEVLTPELFPRVDGTTWVCAVSSSSPLPIDPAEVVATTARTHGWRRCAGRSRRHSPPPRLWRARHASDRSPRMACR